MIQTTTLSLLTGGEQIKIPPYGTRCLFCAETSPWGIIGTSKRLFPASEIHSLYAVEEEDGMTVNFYGEIEAKTPTLGSIFITIPAAYQGAESQLYLHGESAEKISIGNRVRLIS